MSVGLMDQDVMAKPKTLSVKLHMDVIETARIAAAFRGELMQDMLSDLLRPIVEKIVQDEMARRMKSGKPKGGK